MSLAQLINATLLLFQEEQRRQCDVDALTRAMGEELHCMDEDDLMLLLEQVPAAVEAWLQARAPNDFFYALTQLIRVVRGGQGLEPPRGLLRGPDDAYLSTFRASIVVDGSGLVRHGSSAMPPSIVAGSSHRAHADVRQRPAPHGQIAQVPGDVMGYVIEPMGHGAAAIGPGEARSSPRP